DRDPSPDTAASTGGRPPSLIALGRSAGVAVGIDFGKRHLTVAASDLSHSILAEASSEMPDDYDARHGLDEAAVLVDEVLEDADVARDTVLGVGLGVPGPRGGSGTRRWTGPGGSAAGAAAAASRRSPACRRSSSCSSRASART